MNSFNDMKRKIEGIFLIVLSLLLLLTSILGMTMYEDETWWAAIAVVLSLLFAVYGYKEMKRERKAKKEL